jgi:hypothetical protein
VQERFILTPYDRTRDRIRDTETKDCDYIDTMAEACKRLNAMAAEVERLRGRLAGAVDAGARMLDTSPTEAFWLVANAAAEVPR